MPLRYQNQTRKLLQTVIDFNMFNSAKCVFMYCMSLCIGVIILFEIVLLLLNSQVTSLWHYEWKCFVKYCWVNVIIKCVFMYIYMSGRSCHWRDNIRVYSIDASTEKTVKRSMTCSCLDLDLNPNFNFGSGELKKYSFILYKSYFRDGNSIIIKCTMHMKFKIVYQTVVIFKQWMSNSVHYTVLW
jgi:hypothetical protein